MSLENKDYSVEVLFEGPRVFRVPEYQRAFAWKIRPHIETFYEDLLNQPDNRPYYFGTLLLESRRLESGIETFFIVDGQQRLTTLIIFLAQLQARLAAIDQGESRAIQDVFIREQDIRKFYTVKADDAFFWDYIIQGAQLPSGDLDTLSKERLVEAQTYFRDQLEASPLAIQRRLLRIVKEAKVIVFCVADRGEATQIFELQNDRGKLLTQLEAVKSFLMHTVYLKASSLHRRNDVLARIEDRLGNIHKTWQRIEKVDPESGGDDGEDAILRYHWTAFEKWVGEIKPKELLKRHIANMDSSEDVIWWIEKFIRELDESFGICLRLLERRDSCEEVVDLYALGRLAPFYPLLLKTFKYDTTLEKSEFRRVARLLEMFSFRAYGIANVRSDTGLSEFNGKARDFSGNFSELIQYLTNACTEWWRVGQRFEANLRGPAFYHEGKDALYLLWKYENHLRDSPGSRYDKIPWNSFLNTDPKTRWTIEHILAQKAGTDDVKAHMYQFHPDSEEALQKFRENYLHFIGNLVIDSHSANASKGKKDVSGKEPSYLRAPVVSLNELKDKYFGEDSTWNEDKIRARGEALIQFALERWNPSSICAHKNI